MSTPPSNTSKGDFILEGESEEASASKPEDSIPDLPENFETREFLRTAPQHGLFMPLGKEVKVMQCWRCKAYGHRTGDRECPMRLSGNLQLDSERRSREDPMTNFSTTSRKRELKYERVEFLKLLVDDIRREEILRKENKVNKKKRKKYDRKYDAEKSSKNVMNCK